MTISHKSIYLTILLAGAVACKGSGNSGNGDKGDMAGNNNGGGNFTVLSATVTLAAGQGGCANGGVQVNIGLDNGDGGGVARDGTLQDGEIDTNKIVCDSGVPSATTVTLQTPVGLGDTHCMFGGTRIDYGLDNGEGGGTAGNATLETGEIDGTAYACLQKPANGLVVTTPLFAGNPKCQFGGQLVSAGLDDGQPGGIANDGILQAEEVDSSLPHCNPSPDEVFPAPTGSPGTAALDVRGGVGVGEGGNGGNGGHVDVMAFGGALPTSIEAYQAGSVTVDATVAQPTFTPGAHPVVIDADTEIPQVTEALETGLYILANPGVEIRPFAWPLYDGATLVTSLHVNPGKKLTFTTDSDDITLSLAGDILNEGTIFAMYNGDGIYPTGFAVECHHFINQGTVDMRSPRANYEANATQIWAVLGSGGQIWNGPGAVIRTDGWKASDTDGTYLSLSSWLRLIAAGTFYNGGTIRSDGGGDETDYNSYARGSDITIRTLSGNIVQGGTIDASGVTGEQGTGGIVLIGNGPFDFGESSDSWDLPTNSNHPVLDNESVLGPGNFVGTGTIKSRGSDNPGLQNAGNGGQVIVRMVGGGITSNALIDVMGGSVTDASDTVAGHGGRIFLGAFGWAGPDGNGTLAVPSGVTIGGSLNASGGTGDSTKGGTVTGGSGGDIGIFLNPTLTNLPTNSFIGVNFWLTNHAGSSVTGLNNLTQDARIQFLGFGNHFHGEGGQGESSGGSAGVMRLANNVCASTSASCAFGHVGARLIAHDIDLNVAGGNGGSTYPGSAGQVVYDIHGDANQVAASLDAQRILAKGKILAKTGNGNYGGSPVQGNVSYLCEACDVVVSGDVDLRGGDYDYGPYEQLYFGNPGGWFYVQAFSATLASTIDETAGAGPDGIGSASELDLYVFSGTLTGTAKMPVGSFYVSPIQSFTNSGTINLDSLNSRIDGGSFYEENGGLVNAGTITARGATSDASTSSNGGDFRVYGASFDNTGTIDLDGGDVLADNGESGSGGSIRLYAARGTIGGNVHARGGKAGVAGGDYGYGGSGGYGEIAMNNTGTLDFSGGQAFGKVASTGGAGGEVHFYQVTGVNTGTARARGGDGEKQGGAGGGFFFELMSTNLGCVDVAGGAGEVAGAIGTITPDDLSNMCL